MARFGTPIDDGRDFGKHNFFFPLYGDLKLCKGQWLVAFVVGLVLGDFNNDVCGRVRTKGAKVLVEFLMHGKAFAGSKNQGCKVVETVVEMGNRFPFFNQYRLETCKRVVSFVFVLGSTKAL